MQHIVMDVLRIGGQRIGGHGCWRLGGDHGRTVGDLQDGAPPGVTEKVKGRVSPYAAVTTRDKASPKRQILNIR